MLAIVNKCGTYGNDDGRSGIGGKEKKVTVMLVEGQEVVVVVIVPSTHLWSWFPFNNSPSFLVFSRGIKCEYR